MIPKLDLVGQRFGNWTVIGQAESKKRLTIWLCQCDCGTRRNVRTTHLRDGRSKSCGCTQYDHLRNRDRNFPKDIRIRRLYTTWRNMHARCEDTKNISFKNYGGRGITVCDEWNDYTSFAKWAINNGYSNTLTIDRIDSNGKYEPSNCRWIPLQEQCRNKRTSRLATINGITKTVGEWAREYNVVPNTVYRRLNNGMSIIDALKKKERKHVEV